MNYKNMEVSVNSEIGAYSISHNGRCWQTDMDALPCLILGDGTEVPFSEASRISEKIETKGYGWCAEVAYSGFIGYDLADGFEIRTRCWIDSHEDRVHFELWTACETEHCLKEVQWPGAMEFTDVKKGYSVIPMMQGCIIPTDWPHEVRNIEDGRFYSRDAYMPWFGQTDGGSGYIAISETPWDAGYRVRHSGQAGCRTTLQPYWLTSLGVMAYNRRISYHFGEDCDYNAMAKIYRSYVITAGNFTTLKEKALNNPVIEKLYGTPVVHTNIYKHVVPESSLYDKNDMSNNESLTSFAERSRQLRSLKAKGVERAYIHLDGWGKMGYDNQHPDVLPPCETAGGYKGMKELADVCHEVGYVFATHDQYRDYYFDAETFDIEQAIVDEQGIVPEESTWEGGRQAYLCTTFAPAYVRRNFSELKEKGIRLEGTYLDVFAVIEMDECFHPDHRMTRKQCMEKRAECFDYVRSTGIICSSEEPCDWSVPYLDLVHHGPHALSPNIDKGVARGIPVPLFNLVYHECMVLPWSMKKSEWGIPEGESAMLYGLLNGGTAYLPIEASEGEIEQCRVMCKLQEKLVHAEMISHEFLSADYKHQRSVYSDGTAIEINFNTDQYIILEDQ